MARYFLLVLTLVFSITKAAVFAATTPNNISTSSFENQPELNLGILNWADNKLSLENWQASLTSLEASLAAYKLNFFWLTLEEIEAALAANQLDYLITNPGQFVELSTLYPLAPLATFTSPASETASQKVASSLFVKASSQLTSLEDLATLPIKIGAVSPKAFGGFQLVLNEFNQANLQLAEEKLVFTGFPMQQLFSLLAEDKLDAIIVRACLAESLAAEGLLKLDTLKVINGQAASEKCLTSTASFPNWPFLATGKQPGEVNNQVLLALLAGQPSTSSYWRAPLSYQQVYKVFESLRLGPYASFQRKTWVSLVYTHRLWILLLTSVFLILVLHNLRARYLVKTTSAKLKKAMQKQQHHQQEINHLSKFALMGEVTAGLAHELNQPLTSILNYAQGSSQLTKQANQLEAGQVKNLNIAANKIAQQAQQAAAIIKNFRNFLRKTTNSNEQIEVNQLALEAAELIETRVNSAKASFKVRLLKKPLKITANRVEVLQILLNLLTNALDAMQASPVKHLTLSLELANKCLVFKVLDTGEGFASDAQALFAPFYTSRKEGMGLGLNLSQKLAEKYNAKIQLANLASGGCIASLEWPYANR